MQNWIAKITSPRSTRAWLFALALSLIAVPAARAQQPAAPTPSTNSQGYSGPVVANSNGIRPGPGMNAASVGDYSYHSNSVPHRKLVLAWGDVSQGYQHDSVSHALATIERLGYETGAYDTIIRTDSQLVTKGTVRVADGSQSLYAKNLNDFDAIFFIGVREVQLTPQQKADLLSFVHDDGKGLVVAHAALTTFFSWPEFGKMVGGRFDNHPFGIINAPVIVEDSKFPGMQSLPLTFDHTDEYYQVKDFDRKDSHVLLRLDVSHLNLSTPEVHHKDADWPLAWAKMYGKGRVYYNSFGHDPSTWDDRAVDEMYYQAILWALHLTDADVTPRPFPTAAPSPGTAK